MNIRPKNTILFAQTGVKFSQNNLGGANWRQQVFNNYRQHLLDQLSNYGEAQDYGDWLNEMQSRHANIYKLAGGEKGNWQNVAYKNDLVGQYQHDYKGDKRFGTTKLKEEDTYDFNQGISPNFNTRYNIANPPSRISGDNSTKKFTVDNLYSAITDDRRLLGRKGDWDESSTEFKQWQNDLKSRGWETYLDTNDNYYKLRRLAAEPDKPAIPQEKAKINEIPVGEYKQPESIWTKIGQNLHKVAPDLLDTLRLAGNMYNNDRVYKESMKAIKPNLQQSYHTYRQVNGDEAIKQGFYRRATQGEQRAARPITSDLDKQIAYQNEAKRIGDELRAQGDLADNQRIRETSQESMAHADANRERDTTVANSNLTELLKTDAAKHQLTAQKYSADWTNLEQYLMGRQYKLEQKRAKEQELQNQLATLDIQDDLLGDSTLQNFKMQREKAYNDYISAKTPQEQANLKKIFDEANLNYQKYYIQKQRDALHRKYQVSIAKEGTKITKKHKDTSDKFLYKTSRDIVEHFRKMSKMTDDSRIKTLPKPIKLTSHPRKMQLGGVAPFTVYRPLGVGGENAVSTQTSSSTDSKSSKDTAAKDKLDMIKELFKQVQGLPIDVSRVFQEISGVLNRAKAFGEELSTDDIASMYLNVMNRMSQLKYSSESYKQAHTQAVSNEALNEIAVGSRGELILQNMDTGEVKRGSYSEWINSGKKLNPLTNSQVLEMRAKDPHFVFDDDIFNIVNNGVGLPKIAKEIKSLAATLGSQEKKIEGISEVQSNKIKAGLQTLAGYDGTPDGFYKVAQDEKNSSTNVKLALNYIYEMLPTNYKVIMKLHSGSEENSKNLIAQYLTSQTHDFYKEDITPLTGKANKDDKDSLDKVSSNPLLAMMREIGGVPTNYSLITRDSNVRMSVNGTAYPSLPKVKEDMSVNQMLNISGIDGIITNRRGITFGDQQIKPEDLNNIMYSNDGGGTVVTLPCKIVNGVKQVNLDVRDAYERAEQKALEVSKDRTSPAFIKALGEALQKEHLDSLLDSNGLPNKNMFAQFLLVEGYTTDKIDFKRDSQYVEKVNNPDEQLEARMTKALSTDKKKSDYNIDVKDHWSIFEGFYDDIYRGTIFIPLNNNPNAAINSWGGSVNVSQSTELEELYQTANKSSNFNKNNSL